MYLIFIYVFGTLIFYLLLMFGASEMGGEVVTLLRPEPDGNTKAVRIWIVDSDTVSLIEHGDSKSFWINHLGEKPKISLIRGGEEKTYRAVTDIESHDLFHELRREKYGIADRIINIGTFGLLAKDVCTGVPVRLKIHK